MSADQSKTLAEAMMAIAAELKALRNALCGPDKPEPHHWRGGKERVLGRDGIIRWRESAAAAAPEPGLVRVPDGLGGYYWVEPPEPGARFDDANSRPHWERPRPASPPADHG